MKNERFLIALTLGVITAAAISGLSTFDSAAQSEQRPQQRAGAGGPTQAMLQACTGKKSGAACSATGPQGRSIAGTCVAPEGRPHACRAAGSASASPGNPQGAFASSPGAAVPGSEADTTGILCAVDRNVRNEGLGLSSVATWSCAEGKRALSANGVPDHPTGTFPNPDNPNRISAQRVSFSATLTPVRRSGSGTFTPIPGFALNGVKFDPGTAGRCPSGVGDPKNCSLGMGEGEWRIEALGQSSFDFGDDENHAHVQPSGEYHYHGIPEGMLSAEAKAGKAMMLIGWASDGFPIYARFGHADATAATSPLRAMRPSYRLKTAPDSGRPPVSLIPMGGFTQDYEYVAGSGDLDECNGRTAATPEFPRGIYHYYATDGYPFVQRCVKGTPDPSTMRGPPQGGRPPGAGA